MIEGLLRGLGSLGAKSQTRMGAKAAIAQKAATAKATANQGRVYDRVMAAYGKSHGRGASNVGQATSRAVAMSDAYVKRAGPRAYRNSMKSQQLRAGKRRALGLGIAGSVGMTAGRNPNREQTMYRGPMSTGRGIGRYS